MSRETTLHRRNIICPGAGGADVGKDSRCAGLTAGLGVTRAFAALPGSTGVVRRMEGTKTSLIAATDLT